MKQKKILVFGASGAIGRNLIRKLAKNNFIITAVTRNLHQKGYILKTQANAGYINIVEASIFDEQKLKNLISKNDICINLVGILFEKKQTFNQIHALFPLQLSNACNELRIKKLISISALGVKEGHTSKYMQSKLQGEKNIRNIFKQSVILRPSLILGPNCSFFNTFGSLAQYSPIIPLVGSGKTKFAPIYIENVCEAIVKSLEIDNFEPKIYELGGPANYSFKELIEILLREIKKKRILISIPFSMAKFQSYFLQLMPNPLLTPDMVENLKFNNILTGQNPTLKDLGVDPTDLKNFLPKLGLSRFKTGGQFG